MTERKPAGLRFESFVERQIREAQERGEFDDLPGAGKPIPGLTGQYDPMWWVKEVVRREHVSLLPPGLALRKEAEDLLAGVAALPTESVVRARVADYNARVVAEIRRPRDGPLLALPHRLDVAEVLAQWRRRRPSPDPVATQVSSVPVEVPRRRSWRWWRRRQA